MTPERAQELAEQGDEHADEERRASWVDPARVRWPVIVANLVEFANEFGPSDDSDEWEGSGADHAAWLYDLLERYGITPNVYRRPS